MAHAHMRPTTEWSSSRDEIETICHDAACKDPDAVYVYDEIFCCEWVPYPDAGEETSCSVCGSTFVIASAIGGNP